MWYLLIASAGIASTLYALWRAAKAESRAIKAEALATASDKNAVSWANENASLKKTYLDQLARKDDEIAVLTKQRKDALDALENSSCPGTLREALRLSLGLK